MLRKTYESLVNYAAHPRAFWVLNMISFMESSFFPLPPDPLYITMILSKPQSAWRLAFSCTIASVIGGLLGYYIGYTLYESVGQWIIHTYGAEDVFARFQEQFKTYGFWIIAGKGLTPIPYKIVTISCGVMKFDLKTFILASLIARGFRFYLLAGLLRYYGHSVRHFIERHLGIVTIGLVCTLIAGFFIVKFSFS